ncbi:hypothetical protein EV182_008470, partial [Spiromyces aspiralis]
MNADIFTEKMMEALKEGMEKTQEYGHSELTPLHIIAAISEQEDQYLQNILEKAGAKPLDFDRALNKALVRLPAQTPAPLQATPSMGFSKVINKAKEIMKSMKDKFVAVDTFLLACIEE